MILNRALCVGILWVFAGSGALLGQCSGMVFAHLVDGAGWKSSIYLINGSTSAKATYTLTFRGDEGQPVLLSFVDGRRDNQISGTVAGGGVAILETPGNDNDPLAVASAKLSVTGMVSGFAVVRDREAGGLDREATVPLTTSVAGSLVFPFDNTNGFASSIALTVPCGPESAVQLTAVAADEAGAALGQTTLKVNGGGHRAFMIADQMAGAKGKRGVLRISVPAAPAAVHTPVRSVKTKRVR
jgi:hypothetical protein